MSDEVWRLNPLKNNERRSLQELELWAMVDEHHPEREKLLAMVSAKREMENKCKTKESK
jgi:hypothetical protein